MNRLRVAAVVGAAVALLGVAACSEGGSPVVEGDPGTTTTTAPPGPTIPPDDAGDLLALWPADGVVAFQEPQDVATDFLEQVVGGGTAGDFRSVSDTEGQVDVLFSGEGGGQPVVRSTLLVRKKSDEEGWFVVGATNPNAAIAEPVAGATVQAGSVHVTGVGRGFEGAVTVKALGAGLPGEPLATAMATAGSAADPEPFAVDLDLSGAQPGQTVTLLVQGGVGVEGDPGDFGAIPVVIAAG